MSENAITYYPSLLHFRLNTVSSFNLLSYGFKLSHHCGYLPLNPIQFLYLSLKAWHPPDIGGTMWSQELRSRWTTLTFSGSLYTPVYSSCSAKGAFAPLTEQLQGDSPVNAVHAMTKRAKTSPCAGLTLFLFYTHGPKDAERVSSLFKITQSLARLTWTPDRLYSDRFCPTFQIAETFLDLHSFLSAYCMYSSSSQPQLLSSLINVPFITLSESFIKF